MFIWFLRSEAKLGAWRHFTQHRLSFLAPIRSTVLNIMMETERPSSWVYLYDKNQNLKQIFILVFLNLFGFKSRWKKKITVTFPFKKFCIMSNYYIYGVFARLNASVCVLMQTFGPFKLKLKQYQRVSSEVK